MFKQNFSTKGEMAEGESLSKITLIKLSHLDQGTHNYAYTVYFNIYFSLF